MPFGSRAKGASAEREVAKLLEGWWGSVEPGAKFVKTPLSGGWSGPAVRAGFKASGDLMTTAARFPFAVEVKRRESWSLERLVAGKASPVWAWWKQAIKQADEMSVIPMLWLRRNRQAWRVMVPWDTLSRRALMGVDPLVDWEPWVLEPYGFAQDPVMTTAEAFLRFDPRRFAGSCGGVRV